MAALSGSNAKVTLGSTLIVGLGNWNLAGVTTEQYDVTAFGDTWKQYIMGLKDGGQITFNGVYDKTDTTGQDQLRSYNADGTLITSIRFYVDSTSYFAPATTNPVSGVYVTEWAVTADKADALRCSFTCKVSGKLTLI